MCLFLAAGLPASGFADDDGAAGTRPQVTVSIAPQAWLVERLAGAPVALQVALAPGESPANFDPTPRRLAELSRTEIYLAVGVPMERVLLTHLRNTCPRMAIADLAADVDRLAADGHDHGIGAVHAHEFDPHVWLSPRRMSSMAGVAADLLATLMPGRAEAIRDNLGVLRAELDTLDAELAALLAPAAGRTMVVFHPSFGYLAHDYGFTQTAIEKDGLPPSPRHLASVLTTIRDQGVRTVFVQPQAASAQLRAMADAEGLRVEVLDPLARNYPENLRRMAAAIGAALAPGGAEENAP